MQPRSRHFVSLIALLFLAPASAAADAVGPPDPTLVCPTGSTPEVNHCGTVCIRRRCDTSADCRTGEVCRDVELCVIEEPYCGGWTMDLYERVEDCAGGCSGGTCRAAAACVLDVGGVDAGGTGGTDAGGTTGGSDAGGASTGTDAGSGAVVTTYGCGCRSAGGGASSGAGVLGFLMVAFWIRRRVRLA